MLLLDISLVVATTLPSDSKNIKELLYWIAKYIENKKIDTNKSNDIPDLKGIVL